MLIPSAIDTLTAENQEKPDPIKKQERRQEDFDTWVSEVRDPAYYRSEGPRRLEIGSCSFEYEIAPLPDGRWAMQANFNTDTGGGGHGWCAYESRDAALGAFLEEARRYFDMKRVGSVTNKDIASGPKMLAYLEQRDLFGFKEPDPVPREEWWPEMIADRIGTMQQHQSFDLLDVVRGGDYKPVSKSGSFFEIPLPPGMKDTWNHDHDEEGECEDDEDDE